MTVVGNIMSTAADAPAGLSLTHSYGTNIEIAWNPSTDEYHKKYKLYYSDDNFTSETLLVTTTKTNYTHRNLSEGTHYYRVTDIDIYNMESDPSDIESLDIGELLPYASTTSVSGTSTIDLVSELGRKAISGTIENKGPDTVTIELSYDGTTFPQSIDLEVYDVLSLEDTKNRIAIDTIKLTADDAEVSLIAI